MKKIAKLVLFILTFIFTILLGLVITIFTVRKISSNYISKEYILNSIDNIDINELLLQNGEELEEIKIIKQKLKEAGIEEELINEFISSAPIKEVTKEITNQVIDYIVYDKKIEYNINKDEIYLFLEENMSVISKELQDKNVPKSEYLTEENQEKILNKIKEYTPIIEEKLNNIILELENKLQNNEYKQKLDKLIDVAQLIYSDKVTILLYGSIFILIILIILTRRSIFKSLKWVGISYLLSSICLYIPNIIVPIILKDMNQIPEFIYNIINVILKEIIKNLNNYSYLYIIIGFILIVLNIVVYFIKEKLENRKFDKI